MLFRKKIEKACVYCRFGTSLDEGHILCSKKGMRKENEHCFRFAYDPCKRIPKKAKPIDFSKYNDHDFSL